MKAPFRQAGIPVFLYLGGKRVLVAGDTPAAVSACLRFMEAGARVVFASPRVPPELKGFPFRWTSKRAGPAMIRGCELVYAATGSQREDSRIRKIAQGLGRWVGGEHGGFSLELGTYLGRGPLVIAFWLFQGGPWLRRWVWRRLLRQWGGQWRDLLKTKKAAEEIRRIKLWGK